MKQYSYFLDVYTFVQGNFLKVLAQALPQHFSFSSDSNQILSQPAEL